MRTVASVFLSFFAVYFDSCNFFFLVDIGLCICLWSGNSMSATQSYNIISAYNNPKKKKEVFGRATLPYVVLGLIATGWMTLVNVGLWNCKTSKSRSASCFFHVIWIHLAWCLLLLEDQVGIWWMLTNCLEKLTIWRLGTKRWCWPSSCFLSKYSFLSDIFR